MLHSLSLELCSFFCLCFRFAKSFCERDGNCLVQVQCTRCFCPFCKEFGLNLFIAQRWYQTLKSRPMQFIVSTFIYTNGYNTQLKNDASNRTSKTTSWHFYTIFIFKPHTHNAIYEQLIWNLHVSFESINQSNEMCAFVTRCVLKTKNRCQCRWPLISLQNVCAYAIVVNTIRVSYNKNHEMISLQPCIHYMTTILTNSILMRPIAIMGTVC